MRLSEPSARLCTCWFALLLGACAPAQAPDPIPDSTPDQPPDQTLIDEPDAADASDRLDQGSDADRRDLASDLAMDQASPDADMRQAADAASPDQAADQQADLRPDDSPGQPAWGDAALELGHGRDALIPIKQRDVVRWEAGPQGGYHIWTGVAIAHRHIEALSVEQRRQVWQRYWIWRQDGTLLAQTARQGGLRPDDAQAPRAWSSVGQYAVLEAPVRPRRLDGELLRYRAEITTPAGVALWREALITSQCCD